MAQYKRCLVPSCTNSNRGHNENKIFICVPKNPDVRRKWLLAIGRTKKLSDKTTCYICEEHFDLNEDMENYIRFKTIGGLLFPKPNVVPHKNIISELTQKGSDGNKDGNLSDICNIKFAVSETLTNENESSEPEALLNEKESYVSAVLPNQNISSSKYFSSPVLKESVALSVPQVLNEKELCVPQILNDKKISGSKYFSTCNLNENTSSSVPQALQNEKECHLSQILNDDLNSHSVYFSVSASKGNVTSSRGLSFPQTVLNEKESCVPHILNDNKNSGNKNFSTCYFNENISSSVPQALQNEKESYLSRMLSDDLNSHSIYFSASASKGNVTSSRGSARDLQNNGTVSKYFSATNRCFNVNSNAGGSSENQKETEKGVQCQIVKKYRSQSLQVKPKMVVAWCSPIKKKFIDAKTSPINIINNNFKRRKRANDDHNQTSCMKIGNNNCKQIKITNDDCSYTSYTSSENQGTSSDPSYINESLTTSSKNSSGNSEIKGNYYEVTKERIAHKPMEYVGIDKKCYFLVELVATTLQINFKYVLLCFKKIKLNESFEILGDDFGISKGHASRIFNNITPLIAVLFRRFIYWPEEKDIVKNLPIPFRKRYSKVTNIIDCLEIQIEKPSDAYQQSLTWSEYKKCNTMKFLIGSTPDGTCTYISEGFGGRATDCVIVEESGYLEKVRKGNEIMADRGFKGVAALLAKQDSKLVRPPSTSEESPMTKADVKLTKQIAALRIHVERVIGRLRLYKLLGPHATVDNKLILHLNDIITVACGLINLQSPIINKL